MPTGLAVCFKRGLWITRLIQIRSFMMFFALIIMLFDTCIRFLDETITFQFICIICAMPLVLCTEGIKRSIFFSSFQLWEFLVLRNVLVLLRHLYEILPLVRCHHNGYCISIQSCRWTYKRCASATRFLLELFSSRISVDQDLSVIVAEIFFLIAQSIPQ